MERERETEGEKRATKGTKSSNNNWQMYGTSDTGGSRRIMSVVRRAARTTFLTTQKPITKALRCHRIATARLNLHRVGVHDLRVNRAMAEHVITWEVRAAEWVFPLTQLTMFTRCAIRIQFSDASPLAITLSPVSLLNSPFSH